MNKDERKQNQSVLVMRPFYKQHLKNLATFNCSLLFINCKMINVICYYKIDSSITGRFLSNFYQINKDFQINVYKICYREVAETRSLCMYTRRDQETTVQFLDQEYPLEKRWATHSSIVWLP